MIRMLERSTTCPPWRIKLIIALCTTALLVLLAGALWRSLVQGDMLIQQSDKRYIDSINLQGERGVIWDRNGRPLAISAVVYSAFINPILFTRWARGKSTKAHSEAVANIARSMQIDDEKLRGILARNIGFAYLRHSISPEEMQLIGSRKLPHLRFERRYRRFYPAAQEAAHITGFTDHTGKGQAGIEGAEHGKLAPQEGELLVLRTASGEVLEQFKEVPAVNGRDVVLTIDARLQYYASVALSRTVEKHNATSGALILMDALNGEIMAMANVPTYNPNSGKSSTVERRNRAIQDLFEPGSTIKPLLAAIAMEEDLIEPGTVLKTARPIRFGRYTVKDKKIDTDLSVGEILMRSSNVGAVRIAELLDDQKMYQGYSNLGFSPQVLLGLPGEITGVLRDYESWRPVEKATMAYGYGLSVNLLQLTRAYAAIGNKGLLPRPTIVRGGPGSNPKQVLSAATATSILRLLENVVSTKGTAPKASISGYRVAGKTGTTHKRKDGVKGYDQSRYQSVFVGMAPASSPRFICAVMIDEPTQNGYYGGTVAAPVFSELMSHALRMYSIPPDQQNEPIDVTDTLALAD